MMREVRGQRVDNREWIYGTGVTDFLNVYPENKDCVWMWSDYQWIRVVPETVGQDSGVPSNNGKCFYEGDKIESEEGEYGIVIFEDGTFRIKWYYICERGAHEYRETESFSCYHMEGFAIDGTIHDSQDEKHKAEDASQHAH